MQNYNPSECQGQFLAAAFDKLNLDDEMQSVLKSPYREIQVELPVRLRDGKLIRFQGFRVQHNNCRGPFKGGLRFHPSVDLDHCRALAFSMTWKTALYKIPFGGGKGGVACDPKQLDAYDLEVLMKKFCASLGPLVGPNIDIVAPDVGTGAREMAWFFDSYASRHGYIPGVVTGKPLDLGGVEGRVEATGMGVCDATLLAASSEGLNQDGMTVAIQGFGNVGSYLAKCLVDKGCRVVAVSDVNGGIFCGDGLDIHTLFDQLEDGLDSVTQATIKKDNISHEDFFQLDVDVLIPAALEAAISSENVAGIKAKMIVEAANIPVTNNADEVLKEKGIPVIPDIFANAGGVAVSYIEWCGNHQRFSWSKSKVLDYLDSQIKTTWSNILDVTRQEGFSYRDAAYLIAVQRVSEALQMRGLH